MSKAVPALEVDRLTKSFSAELFHKPKVVLQNLTFQIQKGKTTGFVGVNGAGKTTTLKCVLGFIRPTSGEIRVLGEPLSDKIKTQIGFLPERPYYHDFLTAKEFLRFHWELGRGDTTSFESRAQAVLEKVNLRNVWLSPLRSFSKGMLQRIGVAQALLHQPEILILDEPMSGLDPDGRILIKDIIQEQRQAGKTLFFSSHLLGDMDELCDDLVVIDQGTLIYQGDLRTFSKDQGVEKSFRDVRSKLGALR